MVSVMYLVPSFLTLLTSELLYCNFVFAVYLANKRR